MSPRVVASTLAMIGLAACSKMNSNPKAAAGGDKFYAVTVESAAFYHYGPQQANGPDKKLEKGTLINLIRPSFGYCKVKLTSGEQGFVANEDIGVASVALVTAATAPPSRGAARFHLDSPDPRLVMPPEALPEFEPTPIPERSPSEH
ncbi:MAG: hypothetical protein QOE73_1296 [Verrucomicrobiota bacterium]